MTDRISSSVSNVSMFPHTSEGLDMAPSKERNTTMLKLDCLPGRSAGLVDTYSEGFDEITDATSEGKALLDFFYSLEKEPGHDLTLWGRVEELEDQFLVFIGWDERPPLPFRSAESFAQLVDSSTLATVRHVLEKPIEVTNIAFSPPFRVMGSNRKFVHELLIWEVPFSLDPTFRQRQAIQFNELGEYISRTVTKIPRPPLRDLAACHRGWASSLRTKTSAPSERIHVFFFSWRGSEAEARVKDGREEAMWEPWPVKFTAVQEEWKAMGMRSQSLHLYLWDFWIQLNGRK